MWHMVSEFGQYQRDFYRAVRDEPLDLDDQRYVPIYENLPVDEDPVKLLGRQIFLQLEPTSAHLLSGYRGSGKSTELRRLRSKLEEAGYTVVAVDMDDYLNMTAPVDITDLLLVLAGALGETVARDGLASPADLGESWWDRLTGFFTRSKVQLDEVTAGIDIAGFTAGLKANIQTDPSFQRRLQSALAGHLGALAKEVRDYVKRIADAVNAAQQSEGIVFLVDSIEHLTDTATTGTQVQESVQVVFAQHAEQLHLPGLHTIYTIPPHLQILERGRLSDGFGGGISTLTAVKVADREGLVHASGVAMMREVLTRRMLKWDRLFDEVSLGRLIAASGGHLRDYMLLLREAITRSTSFDDDPAALADQAIRQVQRDFRLITRPQAEWLKQLADTGQPPQESDEDLTQLARFSDLHLVLAYRNHEEWYGVHPLARPEVDRLVEPGG